MNNALVIDNQPLYSEALASLVKTAFQPSNVLESTDSSEIMEIIRNQAVDLVILDVVLGGKDGMRLAINILATGYQGKIIFISSSDYSSLSKAAYEMGAHGFLSKNEAKSTIMDAIVSVMRGYTVFKITPNQSSSNIGLSNREAMVFHYLTQGYSNKRISEHLSLSAKTISTYKTRILKKYHAASVVELLNVLDQEEPKSLCR